jgi:Asp-tRNA(Asn)/Glu-tRNA(Gln) amidotransferase A subunit family amidase
MDRLDEFETSFQEKEPRIHAFVREEDRFKRLKNEAFELQRKYKKQENKPALYGKLLGVKDIFHTDVFDTHAGSILPAGELKGEQAATVTNLKQAGMLVSGKTVTTEFAYFAPGPTRNPHNTEHTPGGSSSGSAAAVAAGLVDLALGTQTIGSIIRPASFCGVVGFKPSYGRVSTAGVIPLAPALDHVGVFSHYVDLIAKALPFLTNQWQPATKSSDKTLLAIPIGEYLDQSDSEMRDHFWRKINHLKSKGYRFKEINPFKDFHSIVERNNIILAAQAAQVHAAWYSSYKHLYHPKTAELIERGLKIPDTLLAQALFEQKNFRLDLSTLMDIHGIGAWISPAARGAAPYGIASTGDPIMNLPWTQAGFPTVCVPSGMNSAGLPLGLQIAADFNRDEELIAWAADIEQALAVTI